ncbi:hypothetical protein [Shinella zoogloeoides]|uniref:hypothetical protein n=1 Tax=Shinella zoogloeoides TaxID=352475 RepID=UPI0013C3496D|nr:hypothetical protein [Shinella zoogloeoides]
MDSAFCKGLAPLPETRSDLRRKGGDKRAGLAARNCLILRQVMRAVQVTHEAFALVSPFFAIAVS